MHTKKSSAKHTLSFTTLHVQSGRLTGASSAEYTASKANIFGAFMPARRWDGAVKPLIVVGS